MNNNPTQTHPDINQTYQFDDILNNILIHLRVIRDNQTLSSFIPVYPQDSRNGKTVGKELKDIFQK